MAEDKQKMFIWCRPYKVSYGCSMLIVVASNVDAAKKLACSKLANGYSFGEYRQEIDWSKWNPEQLSNPDRIVDLPCAEWHEWSE